ncbi:MAG TPA: hypothetical protein VKT53_11505 [Candidatus Acidoferrum sp.]|nr:hypothetical protein [Candidatus Acidoferrum sp.]
MTSQRPLVRVFASIVLTLALVTACGTRGSAGDKAKSAAAFERLISLVGEWEGATSRGPVRVTYTLVSGGSALMERLQSSNEPEMITLYTLDGDHLMVTHYCSQGNQPQMRTATITELKDTLQFKTIAVTGLKSPDEGHMAALTLTMPDKDHLTQEWTYEEKGKAQADVFRFTRKS